MRTVLAAITVEKPKDGIASSKILGSINRCWTVIRVHKVQPRRREQFSDSKPESPFPCRIQAFEVSVEACHRKQIDCEIEELIALIFRLSPLEILPELNIASQIRR